MSKFEDEQDSFMAVTILMNHLKVEWGYLPFNWVFDQDGGNRIARYGRSNTWIIRNTDGKYQLHRDIS